MLRSRPIHQWQLFLLASYAFAFYISLLFASPCESVKKQEGLLIQQHTSENGNASC